jgi:hypothetical protein
MKPKKPEFSHIEGTKGRQRELGIGNLLTRAQMINMSNMNKLPFCQQKVIIRVTIKT